MSITLLLKSLRDRIRRLFHKSERGDLVKVVRVPIREVVPSMTASEVAMLPGATTLNELAKRYNTHRDTLRYRLASSGVTPIAKITSPRLQYIYSTDTFGPLFEKFPHMKESNDGIDSDIQA